MVDIVEFVFVFAIVFVQMFLIHFLQVVEIVRAFGIHTFVDDKVFTVFLMHQAVVAMRTSQDGVFGKTIIFGWRKKAFGRPCIEPDFSSCHRSTSDSPQAHHRQGKCSVWVYRTQLDEI